MMSQPATNFECGWEFQLLGPLEAWFQGRPVPVGGLKQRSILAMLLLEAGRVVPASALADGVWREDAQPTAATLHVHVANLRKALAQAAPDVSDPLPLKTQSPGYVLDVPASSVDVHQFRDEVRRARDGSLAVSERGELLRRALGRWHGRALVGLDDQPFARSAVVYLEEERLAAVELRFQSDLERGAHAEVVGELREFVASHPLRERFWAQLMLALYRSGRQADALAAYCEAREHLVDELGIEPGHELRRLEGEVLRQADSLSWPAASHPSAQGARATVIHQVGAKLPAATLRWPGGQVVLGEMCSIGREFDNVVTVDDVEASGYHAVIRWTPDGFLLSNQRSTNGTFVNGKRADEHVLADGDVIRIGLTEVTFAEHEPSLVDGNERL